MIGSGDVLDRIAHEERQQCVRALLQRPLFLATDGHRDVFRLVRRHADWLRQWFNREPGWQLVVETEYARLHKIPARFGDATRPALDVRQKLPFTRRRYVLLCLVLAMLEKADRQTVLGQIAEGVATMARGDPVLAEIGLEVRFERRAERLDLVAIIRLLLEHGVLLRIQGDEESYIQRSDDVLYTINRAIMARMLAVQRGPSTLRDVPPCERPSRLHADELRVSGDAGRRRRARTTLTRLLLDCPVVYYTDLTDEENAYLSSQRARLTQVIEDATGLVAEVRAEGIAMVDPKRTLTDHAMPDEGTNGHAALLLTEHLTRYMAGGGAGVPILRLEEYLAKQAAKHKAHWRRGVQEPAGLRELLKDVLTRLEALNLIRQDGDTIIPLPALGRYRLVSASP